MSNELTPIISKLDRVAIFVAVAAIIEGVVLALIKWF